MAQAVAAPLQPTANLKAILKDRLFSMIQGCKTEQHRYLLLVLDSFTISVVNSCARVHEVVDEGVTMIIDLTAENRERINMPAIYFLEPTEASIKKLIADYQSSPTKYGPVHLFLTSNLERRLEDMLVACDLLMDRLRTLKILNVEFVASESRFFTLGRGPQIPILYQFSPSPNALQDYQKEVARVGRQLMTLCLTLKENPYIRFSAKSKLCKDIASRLEAEMETARGAVAEAGEEFNPNRGILLVVDRSLDPVAPIMHEYTYQAMIHDLLETKGDLVVEKGLMADDEEKLPPGMQRKEIPIVLDENDQLWNTIRYMHIALVSEELNRGLVEFMSNNQAARFENRGALENASLQDLVGLAKALPQFQEIKKKYLKHVNMASKCLEIFANNHLKNISELEQDMATGVDNEGNKLQEKTLGPRLVEFIKNRDVSVMDKLRLIMIYIISQAGIKENTRKSLFDEANISNEQSNAVRNLFHLGVSLQSSTKAKANRFTPEQLQRFAQRARNDDLELTRFVPMLNEVVSDLLTGRLASTRDDYPYVAQAPARPITPATRAAARPNAAARSARVRNPLGDAADRKNPESKDEGPRFIIYVAGGATFSELRVIHELAQEHRANIILGANSSLTHKLFIQELQYCGSVENEDIKIDMA